MKRSGSGKSKTMPRKTKEEQLYKMAHFTVGGLSFLGGLVASIVTFSRNVASVPYVDQRHDEALKFMEARAIEIRQQAFDHSDMNKKDMMNEIKGQSADIKAMGAKQDVLLDSVRTIQTQMYDQRRR